MSHDNRIYVNTTQNNLVVIDSEHNQLTVTHPITQIIEITQSPRPTIIVTEETPNNVSVTEAVGNTVIVSALGLQGIKGDRGADPELTALELFTGSIQTQVNALQAATSSYVLNSVTSSMTVNASLTSSRLEGIFSLNANSSANNRTISSIGGLAFNNVAQIDQDGTGTLTVKTTPNNTVGGLVTRLTISGSGFVGIGTSAPLSNLHVHKDASGAPLLGLEDGITLTLENDTTNYINFRTPNNVYAGLAFTTPADNSAGYIALRQSTGDMIFSNEKSTGYHTFLTADIERLRIANTETTVRNNLIVSGTTSQFTASGTSLFSNEVDIFGTNSSLNISGSTVGGVTINVSSSLPTQPALLVAQVGTGSALTVSNGHVNLGYATNYFTGGRLNVLGNTYLEGQLYFSGTVGINIQNATSGRALINFASVGNSYLNNGNLGLGTITPTQRLTVVGSGSFSGDVTISNLLTLTPQHPLPTLNLVPGAFAVSSSTPPKPYFYDGANWNALY